jgi:hypothetical protein
MKYSDKLKELKPKLTDEFLATLVEAGKIDGWSTDYIETCSFIQSCFDMADKSTPSIEELEPYDLDYDE